MTAREIWIEGEGYRIRDRVEKTDRVSLMLSQLRLMGYKNLPPVSRFLPEPEMTPEEKSKVVRARMRSFIDRYNAGVKRRTSKKKGG